MTSADWSTPPQSPPAKKRKIQKDPISEMTSADPWSTPPQSPPASPPDLRKTAAGNLSHGFMTRVGDVDKILQKSFFEWVEDDEAYTLFENLGRFPVAQPFPPHDLILQNGLFRVNGPVAFNDGFVWVGPEKRTTSRVKDADILIQEYAGASEMMRFDNTRGLYKKTFRKKIYASSLSSTSLH